MSVTHAYLDELYREIAELRTARQGLHAANVELFDILLGLGAIQQADDDR